MIINVMQVLLLAALSDFVGNIYPFLWYQNVDCPKIIMKVDESLERIFESCSMFFSEKEYCFS